jgi:nucleotide-binding universal stress UspA family protein
MKNILVATDLSTRSDRAVQRAVRLSAKLGLPCHVLSVIDDDLPADMLATLLKDVEARLAQFVRSVAAPGQIVTSAAVAGDPQEVLLGLAEELDAGLVVLGLHRKRPLLDMVRDSTMVRIVRASRRPVLLVKDLPHQDYAKVLVPVSFSPACAAALRAARAIAPKAEMRSFHAVPVPFAGLTGDGPGSTMAQELCAEATRERDVWLTGQGFGGDLPEIEIISGGRSVTMERLAAIRPDLVAVGAHTRSGFLPNVLGSFVTDLIHSPPCDLLVSRG